MCPEFMKRKLYNLTDCTAYICEIEYFRAIVGEPKPSNLSLNHRPKR